MGEEMMDRDQILEKLRSSQTNSYEQWIQQARDLDQAGLDEEVTNYCLARAYVSDDGFYYYLQHILGYSNPNHPPEKQFHEPFHRPICALTTNPNFQYKMIQACRGSFKSSISTKGYATWLIARDFTLTGSCNIRILIGSEVLALANSFVAAVKRILESNRKFHKLFGNHKTELRGGNWGNTITSRFRSDDTIHEPTVSAIALDAPKSGNHYDVIIADDLETERASATREQIEKCWDFYRLLHSLLEPGGEMILVSTRWHYDDIYSRILKASEDDLEHEKYQVLIMPAEIDITEENIPPPFDKMDIPEGGLTFPQRFPKEHLEHLKRRHGSYLYSCQYLLTPVAKEDQIFRREWINYVEPGFELQRRKFRIFVGCDFAYTEQVRVDSGQVRKADFTTVMTVAVDDAWNYYVIDQFRERCSKLAGIKEMFRQYYTHHAIDIGLQKYDRAQIEDVIIQYGYELRKRPRCTWISYPGVKGKNERIKTALQPLFESGKFYILRGMDWLEEELMDFPLAAFDDGLDALCNIVKVSKPPPGYKEKTPESALVKHIKSLKSKRPTRTLKGKKINEKVPVWKRP